MRFDRFSSLELVNFNIIVPTGRLKFNDSIYPVPVVSYSGHDSWLIFLGTSNAPGYDSSQIPMTIFHLYNHGASRITLKWERNINFRAEKGIHLLQKYFMTGNEFNFLRKQLKDVLGYVLITFSPIKILPWNNGVFHLIVNRGRLRNEYGACVLESNTKNGIKSSYSSCRNLTTF